ncbi:MAG: hypothetical protein GY782_11825 [Gammaproteobacteria bacterium]|nr:hypothetical protein [Gammaproteobacteria bacterium]
MTTYNTYQEAKIAMPRACIIKYKDNEDYRFTGMPTREGTTLCGGSEFAEPQDYCIAVEQFLKDGHKFVDGDVYIWANAVMTVGEHISVELANEPSDHDENSFVLKAKALEEKEESVEWNGEGLPPVGALFVTEPNFDIEFKCKYSSECTVVGELCNTGKLIEITIDLIVQPERTFRKPETPDQKRERDLFIEEAMKVWDKREMKVRDLMESLYESGKFKLR